jgi:hypothetical protein
MKRRLDTLADRGCWISHDRIYAFISADHGITEIGYHGMQPVSRNSRVLVRESGVLSFSVRNGAGEQKLQTCELNWQPSSIEAETAMTCGRCSLTVEASGRRLVIRSRLSPAHEHTICLGLAKDAFFTAVHGERTWSECRSEGDSLLASFRDRIMLHSWMNRTGPYAGDFLIPEPTRRKIFSTAKRSGHATRDDLREEFRNTDLPLYDAPTFLRFEGDGFSIRETHDLWLFERTVAPGGSAEFVVECSDAAESPVVKTAQPPTTRTIADEEDRTNPALPLKEFPHLEEFVKTVPALVDSCVVQDYGIPRACPGRYYWIWAWDSLVTMSEGLRWGDSDIAATTVRFIEDHRDDNGHIPARWTRSLVPLDTPSAGGIEFLQASLAYETFLETGERELLKRCLPSFIARFEEVESELLHRGLVTGEGFYPDLLSAFGRTETTAVCMEIGSWYAFCRILENISRELGDPSLERRSGAVAASIARHFDVRFWDEERGFFVDAVDATTGHQSSLHPLFSLLFLQSPLGLHLIRPHLQQLGGFVSRELMTDAGMRTLPLNEAGIGGEIIRDSWYPHWDLYALKLLRRTGDADSIMRWLTCTEQALSRLGYCPEFLALKGFRENDTRAWEHHGSASNLNCVTSWLRGLRESILGFEFDPGGITHLPLFLPIRGALLEGVRWRGSTWTFENVGDGPYFESVAIDGTIIEGCTKIPVRHQRPGDHRVVARYGSEPPLFHVTEVVNAKLLNSERLRDGVEIAIEPLGFVDIAFFSPEHPSAFVENRQVSVEWQQATGRGFFSLPPTTRCTIRIQKA